MSRLKICKKCGRQFPYYMSFGGLERFLLNRELCFICLPLGENEGVKQSVWYETNPHISNGLQCIVCGGELTGKQRKYCSITCKTKQLSSYPYQKDRGIQRKIFLVMQSGGACQKCGYDENLGSLAFHHREPELKKFNLNTRSVSKRTWKAVLEEYEKCDLLCANCHAEEHSPDMSDWQSLFTDVNWQKFNG